MPAPASFHVPLGRPSSNISESLTLAEERNHLVIDAKVDPRDPSNITWITAPNNFFGKALWFFFGRPEKINITIQAHLPPIKHKLSFSTPLTVEQIRQEIETHKKLSEQTAPQAGHRPAVESVQFSNHPTRGEIVHNVIETLYGEVKSFNASRQKEHDFLHKQVTDLVYRHAPRSFLEQLSFHEKEMSTEKAQKIYKEILFSIAENELENYDHGRNQSYSKPNSLKKVSNEDLTLQEIREDNQIQSLQIKTQRANLAFDMKIKAERFFGEGSEIANAWDARYKTALKALEHFK